MGMLNFDFGMEGKSYSVDDKVMMQIVAIIDSDYGGNVALWFVSTIMMRETVHAMLGATGSVSMLTECLTGGLSEEINEHKNNLVESAKALQSIAELVKINVTDVPLENLDQL